MSETKCLAYITPTEPITGSYSTARVDFANGPYKAEYAIYMLPTDIYRYYFFGNAFEVVTINEKREILRVADPTLDDFKEFGLGLIHAVTYNDETSDCLASNGFVYNLDQTVYFRKFPQVRERMLRSMQTARNLALQMYTLNGAVIAMLLSVNVDPKSHEYKYVINRGFVPADKEVIKTMIPKKEKRTDDNTLLKQPEIDKLIEKLQGK